MSCCVASYFCFILLFVLLLSFIEASIKIVVLKSGNSLKDRNVFTFISPEYGAPGGKRPSLFAAKAQELALPSLNK